MNKMVAQQVVQSLPQNDFIIAGMGITTGKSHGDRAWKGVTFKEINEEGEITGTHGTDGTLPLYQQQCGSSNIEESSRRVPSVPSAPAKRDESEDYPEPGE